MAEIGIWPALLALQNELEARGGHALADGTAHPVVTLMEAQKEVAEKGGTMRLGAYACSLAPGSLAQRLYGKELVEERHRYEFNNAYRARYEEKGMVFSGVNKALDLVEMIELPGHLHFVGCQFHPEFKSKPFAPHPLFAGFVKVAVEQRERSMRA